MHKHNGSSPLSDDVLSQEITAVSKRRTLTNYTFGEHLARIAWGVAEFALFRLSPRPLWAYRASILRLFGATIGKHVRISPTAKIFFPWQLTVMSNSSIGDNAIIYNLGRTVIGRRVTISQRAHLCGGTHDYTQMSMPLIKAEITINDDVWIAAEAFVGPSVCVGRHAIIGARAVAVRDVDAGVILAGNPGKRVGTNPRKTHDQEGVDF